MDFLLRWIAPLLVALSGAGLWSRGELLEHGYPWKVTAWVFWILSPILASTGYAIAVGWANEIESRREFDRKWQEQKAKQAKPEGGLVMLSETTTSMRWTFLEGIDDKLLIEIADDWARGGKFSEPAWKGRLSSGRFRELQDLFLKREILVWKNADHRQGVEWTAAGRGLLRRAREGLPAPLKRLEVLH